MGFSARYHAASLAAVFLALAIGILIGSAVGDNVVSGARGNLEDSLIDDLKDARGRADDLNTDLGRSEDFAQQIYPALVEQRLEGKRIGLLAFGTLPSDVSDDINGALAPTGGKLAAVGVIREPPETATLATDLSATRFADIDENSDSVQALGTGIGRQLVLGGPLIDEVRDQIFSRASGRFADLDGLIIVRSQPDDVPTDDRTNVERLESGILDGIEGTSLVTVGVETEDTEPSSVSLFQAADMSTVDNVDRVAGRVAMIFSLLGATGNFGSKDSADQLLPDLLAPTPSLVEGDTINAPQGVEPAGGSTAAGAGAGTTGKTGATAAPGAGASKP